MDNEYEFDQDMEEGDVAAAENEAAVAVPRAVCPLVIEPEIDIEVSQAPFNTSEDTALTEHPSPSFEDSSDKHPSQESTVFPLQVDHPETTSKTNGSESLSQSENLSVSIQQLKEAQLEVPNYLVSHYEPPNITITVAPEDDTEVSTKPNQFFSPNPDNSQSEISAQVPFTLAITSPAMYPCVPQVGKPELEEMKEGENESKEEIIQEIDVVETTPMQSQTIHQGNDTEGPLQVQRESACAFSFSQISTDSASCQDEGDLSCHLSQYEDEILGSESLSVKKPDLQTEICVIKSETTRNKAAETRVEDAQVLARCEKDVPGITVTHLGPTREDIVSQSLLSPPTTSDPRDSVHLQQRQGQGPELRDVVDVDMASASETTACKAGGRPVVTSLFKSDTSPDFTASFKSMASQEKDRDLCSKEKLVQELFQEDPAPLQTQHGLESQLAQQPLPIETAEVPSAQPEVGLGLWGQTLSPTFAILCAAIGLVVGFQEAGFFLILGLYIVAHCF